jgi:hypothetical protein
MPLWLHDRILRFSHFVDKVTAAWKLEKAVAQLGGSHRIRVPEIDHIYIKPVVALERTWFSNGATRYTPGVGI